MALGLAEACDEVQGMVCNPDVGACDGACALENLQFSYIGCDYYPTITLQHDSYNGGTKIFAAVIANSAGKDASITVTRGGVMVDQFVVKAGDVAEVPLKWVTTLTQADSLERGPVRLRTALQFSLNIPAIKAGFINGLEHQFERTKDFGLVYPGTATPVASMSIGTLEVHPIDMISA